MSILFKVFRKIRRFATEPKKTLREWRNGRARKKLGMLLGDTQRSYLSSNCLAQMCYQVQNQPYKSPTIAAVIVPRDFVKFCANLKEYLALTPAIDEQESARQGFPVLRLGDIRIDCIHAKDAEYEKARFVERCGRVDFDNLVLMMSERDGCTVEDLIAFDALPYKHKLVFTAQDYPFIKSALCLPSQNTPSVAEDTVTYVYRLNRRKRWDRLARLILGSAH